MRYSARRRGIDTMGGTIVDLGWLERWYQAQCDGDWEHHSGVTIETLDNPGWLVKIDLRGVEPEGSCPAESCLLLVNHPATRTATKVGPFG